MRVLVTGGAGFIGSHIVDAAVAAGHDVASVDNLFTGKTSNLNPGARFHQVDVTDAAKLAKVFEEEKPEVVNHHAAQADVRRSMADPGFDATVNIVGTLNLLQLCVKHQVSRVIFASTCAIFSEPEHIPMDELHPVAPQSAYGMAKYTVENYLRLFGDTYGLRYKVFRYGNVFGPKQDPKGEAGVVAIFVGQMLDGVQSTIFGDGTKTRDYVYVGDVVDANLRAMEPVGDNQIFNLARGIEVSDFEIFDAVRKAVGVAVEPVYAKKRPGEADRVALDASKARRILGWTDTVSLQAGVEAVVAQTRASSS